MFLSTVQNKQHTVSSRNLQNTSREWFINSPRLIHFCILNEEVTGECNGSMGRWYHGPSSTRPSWDISARSRKGINLQMWRVSHRICGQKDCNYLGGKFDGLCEVHATNAGTKLAEEYSPTAEPCQNYQVFLDKYSWRRWGWSSWQGCCKDVPICHSNMYVYHAGVMTWHIQYHVQTS